MFSFRLGKLRISFSIWFFAQLFCCMTLLRDRSAAAYLLLCIGHELAHVLGLCLCGGSVDALRFNAGSVKIVCADRLSERRRRLVSAAGPVFNLAAAAVLLWLNAKGSAVFSMVLAAFNLLPVGDSDGAVVFAGGGRALHAAVSGVLGILLAACLYTFTVHCGKAALKTALVFFLTSIPQQNQREMGYTNCC